MTGDDLWPITLAALATVAALLALAAVSSLVLVETGSGAVLRALGAPQ